jgi:hypothetical protein
MKNLASSKSLTINGLFMDMACPKGLFVKGLFFIE